MSLDRYKIGTLADAIAVSNGYDNSLTDSFINRNPGMLMKKDKIRKFICTFDGYKSLMDSIEKHCERYPNYTIKDLLTIYGFEMDKPVNTIIEFLNDNNVEVTASTRLSFFSGV